MHFHRAADRERLLMAGTACPAKHHIAAAQGDRPIMMVGWSPVTASDLGLLRDLERVIDLDPPDNARSTPTSSVQATTALRAGSSCAGRSASPSSFASSACRSRRDPAPVHRPSAPGSGRTAGSRDAASRGAGWGTDSSPPSRRARTNTARHQSRPSYGRGTNRGTIHEPAGRCRASARLLRRSSSPSGRNGSATLPDRRGRQKRRSTRSTRPPCAPPCRCSSRRADADGLDSARYAPQHQLTKLDALRLAAGDVLVQLGVEQQASKVLPCRRRQRLRAAR